MSHLLQMRGLKQGASPFYAKSTSVASFTDAWIETGKGTGNAAQSPVASFTDAWIETAVYSACALVN